MAVNPIPNGYQSVIPYLMVEGVTGLIDFLKHAFEATEMDRVETPDGTVSHAELRIGDSVVMLAEARDGSPAMPGSLYHYVTDVDAAYRRAIEAGGISLTEPADQFYGDRTAGVKDVAGNTWWIGTHVEDVTPEEMRRRHEARGEESVTT